ncbi:ATP-dependent exoDNAse (exonuclease V) beta subunit [Alteromonadaceae bacterium 2753L.S.0a.02]|nr:ATP-dependent exoDNAse (exonuclease V) beta subunit [Alteromonadaceae bacterium 2753L.S.0a.02]
MNIPDAQQRLEALNPNSSFICEAPAGSGKTELLTQRFLVLLARVKRPEEILAITFTRKATGEMRERLLQSLQMAQLQEPEESHRRLTWKLARDVLEADSIHNWQLLQNPNRLQIKTFDSLCTSLTRQLPMESSFGSQPQICDDANELYRSAVHALLATLEDDCHWAEALAVVLQLLDNRFNRVEALLVQLLSKREQWLPLIGRAQMADTIREKFSEHFTTVIRETIAQLQQLIPTKLQSEIISLAGYAAHNLQTSEKTSVISHCLNIDVDNQALPDASPEGVAKWLGLLEMLKTQKGEWRKNVTVTLGFPSGKGADKKACDARKAQLKDLVTQLREIPGLDDALNDLKTLPTFEVDAQQWQLLQALFTVLPVLTAQLTLVFAEKNQVDFTEISLAARRALGSADEPSQLSLKMDYRLSHILVDEFQDTSAGQIELLNQLTAGWQPDDQRTLFCVGDAMQSIYAFRGANVGLFLSAREQGLENVDLQSLRLTANFRSQAGIVTWVNHTFARAFPEKSNISHGAVSYSASDSINPDLPGDAVTIHGFIDDNDGEREAAAMVNIIRACQTENPEGTIAVLVRSRNALSALLPALQNEGMQFRAVDLQPLGETAVVQDLLSLSRALLHPADRVAWLSLLRAPWCGLLLQDLEIIANQSCSTQEQYPTLLQQCQRALELKMLGDDALLRLNKILPVLQTALAEQLRKPLRDWVEGVWLALGGGACVANAEALENAHRFFELLETWEYACDLPSFRVLHNAVAGLFAAPDPQADDRLQLMTIHKSKGLQFDTVIVPGLARRGNNRYDDLLLWHERVNHHGEAQLLMSPLTQVSGSERHPNYQYLVAESGKKAVLETCRLLYVACTRARQRLHLCFTTSENSKNPGELRAPAAGSLLSSIWASVALHVQPDKPPQADENHQTSALSAPEPEIQRLVTAWQSPAILRENLLADAIPPYDYDESLNRPDWTPQDPTARYSGTLVHRYLQHITEQGVQNWDSARVLAQIDQIHAALREMGVPRGRLSGTAENVVQQLCRVLEDERGQTLLGNHYPFQRCEYPVSIATPEGLQHWVMDRVFTTQQGITWVVDYKTGLPDPDQNTAAFLAQQRAVYLPKMKSYRTALLQLGFEQVRAALYFPAITEWLELTEV